MGCIQLIKHSIRDELLSGVNRVNGFSEKNGPQVLRPQLGSLWHFRAQHTYIATDFKTYSQ